MDAIESLIRSHSPAQQELVRELRKAILGSSKQVSESVKWNSLTYSVNKNICSIVVHKKHINLQFFFGKGLPDKASKLEGTGKAMRHLKIKSKSDIDRTLIETFVKESIKEAR